MSKKAKAMRQVLRRLEDARDKKAPLPASSRAVISLVQEGKIVQCDGAEDSGVFRMYRLVE